MIIMEIKFQQLLLNVQKRTIRCNLEIANIWIEEYKRFQSSMVTIRSIIVLFILFCWETSKKFLLTFERKNVNLKMLKTHNSVAHNLTRV